MLKKSSKYIPLLTTRGNIPVKDRLHILNKEERYAVLATYADGQPYTSLIAYALTGNLKGVVFATPKNTSKYKMLLRNPQVSVLIDSRQHSDGDYLSIESITAIGAARLLRKGRKLVAASSALSKKHPRLSAFITSSTTAVVLIEVTHYIHVDSFQSISEWLVK